MPEIYDIQGKRIWLAGHTGLVGSAVLRALNKIDCEVLTPTHTALDLTRQRDTEAWITENKPEVIIIAAARVGGIKANAEHPAEFLYENLAIAQNIIHAAFLNKVEKLLFLGSSCIYPKFAEQPIKEKDLLSGTLEPTNEAYALAKIAGVKLCESYRRQHGCNFISLMPCNIYGVGDRWNDEQAHVIPMLISRMYRAKIDGQPQVNIWGSGEALREFLFADDLAEGILAALRQYSGESHINIGSGKEISITALAKLVKQAVGYEGELVFDSSMPDGCPRKILDSSRMLALGWRPKTDLEKGLKMAYEDFLISVNSI